MDVNVQITVFTVILNHCRNKRNSNAKDSVENSLTLYITKHIKRFGEKPFA